MLIPFEKVKVSSYIFDRHEVRKAKPEVRSILVNSSIKSLFHLKIVWQAWSYGLTKIFYDTENLFTNSIEP